VTGLGIQGRWREGRRDRRRLRDLSEFVPMRDFPVYYKGSHASAMADQVGFEWNAPVRIGAMTVLPGDVVIADVSGVLAFPPQLTADVIRDAESTVHVENFKREMMRSRKYGARDSTPS
jgi:4-hydroxy-4-methyl-2-oxoglutarate aldolase